jgi:uncharacterized DUF497 family protein
MCNIKVMGATVIFGDFEWDEDKAAANELRHGVTFELATAVFVDVRALIEVDDSSGEGALRGLGHCARRSLVRCCG